MKRFNLTILLALFSSNVFFAQDIIYKLDGSEIKANVTDILDDNVKYKKFDNPDGPTYSISTANIEKIKYENGSIDKFAGDNSKSDKNESSPEKTVSEGGSDVKSALDDEDFKRQIEGMAKEAGEQVMHSCTNKADNYSTEIYWDGVYKNSITNEITIPIRVKWDNAFKQGDRWVRGTVKISSSGSRVWTYQNDSGFIGSGCAQKFRFKN